MNLIHIVDNLCPHCGAQTVSESVHGKHTNGQRFEERRFDCGLTLKWSPNFSQLEQSGECTRSVAYKKKKEKREDAKNALINFINNLDVDDVWKNIALDKFKYIP